MVDGEIKTIVRYERKDKDNKIVSYSKCKYCQTEISAGSLMCYHCFTTGVGL